jgi:hypothetical protein
VGIEFDAYSRNASPSHCSGDLERLGVVRKGKDHADYLFIEKGDFRFDKHATGAHVLNEILVKDTMGSVIDGHKTVLSRVLATILVEPLFQQLHKLDLLTLRKPPDEPIQST